jgi:hypothetical protein
MKYSDAFQRLYQMSLNIDLYTEVQYKRVAIYIGRVMMAENSNGRLVSNGGRSVKDLHTWAKELRGLKEQILPHIIRLTDAEWEKIHKCMMKYAEISAGTPAYRAKRIEWVHSLDTMREFER